MSSVTSRISQIKQPWGGYLKPKDFDEIVLNDGIELNPEENIHGGLIGLTVEYMTRYMMGNSVENAFKISLIGAKSIRQEDIAKSFSYKIIGLDDQSIMYACKLVGYDVCARADLIKYKPVEDINADDKTIFNIRTMINRSLSFWKRFGPVIREGFTFDSAYTPLVTSGDGDYLTKDTLWDFKVIKSKPTSQLTLQLLMYYLLGRRSIHFDHFHGLEKLGIYNPRQNKAYTLAISTIDSSVIKEVSTVVLGIKRK